MENLLGVVAFICAVWVIYDVWTKQKMTTGKKVIWTIFAIILNIITAIVYYFLKRK